MYCIILSFSFTKVQIIVLTIDLSVHLTGYWQFSPIQSLFVRYKGPVLL